MIEYYGWLNISDDAFESNTDELLAVAERVRERITHLENLPSRTFNSQWLNGQYILLVAGSRNHRTKDVEEVIALFEEISQFAQGSYGLLYLLDDEDLEMDNKFQVFKIAKGKMTKEQDTLLSPLNPTIDD